MRKRLTEKQLDNICVDKLRKGSIKAVGGVDTLYFFSDVTGELYHNFFFSEIDDLEKGSVLRYSFDNSYGYDEFYQLEYLGYSGTSNSFIGHWFHFYIKSERCYVLIARIGFKNPKKQHNVLNCFVQLEGSSIYTFGVLKSTSFIFDFLNTKFNTSVGYSNSQVTRVDVNAFINYDFSNINKQNFRTCLSRHGDNAGETYEFGNRGNVETITFGKRGSCVYFKLYNKLLELRQKVSSSSFIKAYYLACNFDIPYDEILKYQPDYDVWNLEFSFNREIIKQFNLYTLDNVLNSVVSLFKYGMDYVVFLGYDTAMIQKKRDNNKQHLLKPYELWSYIKENASFNTYEFSDDYINRVIKKSAGAHKDFYITMIKAQLRHIRENGLSLTQEEFLELY